MSSLDARRVCNKAWPCLEREMFPRNSWRCARLALRVTMSATGLQQETNPLPQLVAALSNLGRQELSVPRCSPKLGGRMLSQRIRLEAPRGSAVAAALTESDSALQLTTRPPVRRNAALDIDDTPFDTASCSSQQILC